MKKILCMIGLHRWGRWRVSRYGDLKHEGKVLGYYIDQERECEWCGRIGLRNEET